MKISTPRAFLSAVYSAMVLLASQAVSWAEKDVGRTPTFEPSLPVTLEEPKNTAPTAQTAAPALPEAPPSPYAGAWSTWPKMTGDWLGARDSLAAKGITLDSSLTQFYQGVTDGGRSRDWEYGGKVDNFFNFDGEKLGLWKGFFVTMHAETRYGDDINRSVGSLIPSNTAMLFPRPNEDLTVISGLKAMQFLSPNLAVYFGRINVIDEYKLGFSGGRGVDAFMNLGAGMNVIPLRTLPYTSWGAGFVFLKEMEPVFSVLVLDPVDHTTTVGISDMFSQGATINVEGRLPIKPFGLPGHQIVGGFWGSRSYSFIDKSNFFFVPGEGIRTARESSGSWSLYYAFDQYLWVDPCNPKRGWGAFGNLGLADGNPSPFRYFANIGLGGSSPLSFRPLDTFGAAYYYVGLSDDFKGLFDGPILRPRFGQGDEHGIELFYNIAITPWCHLTADLQVITPSTERLESVVVPGARLKLDF